MAESQSNTSTFAWTERDRIGDWTAGFTAGEGSFILYWQRQKGRVPHGLAKFVIALRDDDAKTIRDTRDFLGCGTIHARNGPTGNPQVRLVVSRAEDLAKTVVPLFDKYPLRAKKRRDFEIWKSGVELIYRVSARPMTRSGSRGFQSKWTEEERQEFAAIAEMLNSQRRYLATAGS